MPDPDGPPLSTTQLAQAAGYSPQQVRDLEHHHVLSPARRTSNGYRHFTPTHLRELTAYRQLAHAVGPVQARHTMSEIRQQPADNAIASVLALHTSLNHQRAQALAARSALLAIRTEAQQHPNQAPQDTMTIRELAGALGVNASTLRYWEQQGLLHPQRTPTPAGSARRYPLPAIHDARIVLALRTAGYRIPEVSAAMTALHDLGDTGASLAALDRHLTTITGRYLALLHASSTLADIIEQTPPTAVSAPATNRL